MITTVSFLLLLLLEAFWWHFKTLWPIQQLLVLLTFCAARCRAVLWLWSALLTLAPAFSSDSAQSSRSASTQYMRGVRPNWSSASRSAGVPAKQSGSAERRQLCKTCFPFTGDWFAKDAKRHYPVTISFRSRSLTDVWPFQSPFKYTLDWTIWWTSQKSFRFIYLTLTNIRFCTVPFSLSFYHFIPFLAFWLSPFFLPLSLLFFSCWAITIRQWALL